jgi:hypothetical protein|tara:strand:+ start:239 stop:451 length:213 start_codon:yes stop_codon:yes gene_type:complete
MNSELKVKNLITKQEAASILELSDSGVTFLSKKGELDEVRFSKRRVLYDLDKVLLLASRRGLHHLQQRRD